MSDCFFCGAFVGEENGDGGCKGRTIGNRDVCEQCLSELKYVLDSIKSMEPIKIEGNVSKENTKGEEKKDSVEENILVEEDSSEEEQDDNIEDPFSFAPKL